MRRVMRRDAPCFESKVECKGFVLGLLKGIGNLDGCALIGMLDMGKVEGSAL